MTALLLAIRPASGCSVRKPPQRNRNELGETTEKNVIETSCHDKKNQ